ncbi:restriction endonuclease [Acetobacter pomorum]|uniref:Restriction endonuclease n=1 Tax=Acetobacter pomorum TaxID=65959 RepID=A0A2G4RE37_9PROT|nr:restriction endonuclease subunit S [Acetobacter pomorum]PHY94834.1 restriction endonuclease [Acetobacter pomorum]GBR47363.1 type I DNA specificity S subunit [Acetobacter pomorum DSM 11825]
MLPEGWKKRSVAEVCRSVSVGVVIKPSQYYVSAREGVKAFRSANVKEGQINNSDWVYFSRKGHNENKKSELKSGDVLVVRTGYPGTACVVSPEYAGCNAIDIVIARPDIQKIIPTYLCLFTNSEYGKSQVANLQGGMAQKHLNVGAYQQVEIPLPPLPEQKKIAAILSTWDRAIEGTEKLLANSQQQKKALMQHLLTGKKRLPGFSGEWKKKTLSNICQIKTGKKDVNEGCENGKYPFFTCAKQHTFSNNYSYECEAILIAGNGEVGKTHYYNGKFEAYQRTYILSDFTNISVFFLLHFIEFFLPLDISKEKQHGAMPYIKLGTLKDFSVLTPPLPEQEAIAAVLSTADEEITAIESDLSRLRQEKKALMQQLLTGKRRVKVD